MLELSLNMISEKQDYIRTSRAVLEFLLFYKHSNIVQKKNSNPILHSAWPSSYEFHSLQHSSY